GAIGYLADHGSEARSATEIIGLLGQSIKYQRPQFVRYALFAAHLDRAGGHEVVAVVAHQPEQLLDATVLGGDGLDDRWRPWPRAGELEHRLQVVHRRLEP